MTPDEARDLLDGTTPGPWGWADCIGDGGVRHMALCNPAGDKAVITEDAEPYQSAVRGAPADLDLTAAAPTLAAMIAGMREEWGVTYTGVNHGGRHIDWGPETREEADQCAKRMSIGSHYQRPIVVVRRYVTTPEEA